MKLFFPILVFFMYGSSCNKSSIDNSTMPKPITPSTDTLTSRKPYTYLALGDSYTIGQNVSADENYPNQLTRILKDDKLDGSAKIIAVTGWTTDNLANGIEAAESKGELLQQYDLVTLLIGVNNQYQGEEAKNYRPKFEASLQRAISLAGNISGHVIVISIPDWGVTPFAGLRNREEIAQEIDDYNYINRELAEKYNTGYLYITDWTRQAATDPSLLASDNLHLSGKEYARWANALANMVNDYLRKK